MPKEWGYSGRTCCDSFAYSFWKNDSNVTISWRGWKGDTVPQVLGVQRLSATQALSQQVGWRSRSHTAARGSSLNQAGVQETSSQQFPGWSSGYFSTLPRAKGSRFWPLVRIRSHACCTQRVHMPLTKDSPGCTTMSIEDPHAAAKT